MALPGVKGLFSNIPEKGLVEWGLIREGGLFTKSNDLDTNDSFSIPLLCILRIQHTMIRVKCLHSAQFYPKPHRNEDASLFSNINGKSLVISGI